MTTHSLGILEFLGTTEVIVMLAAVIVLVFVVRRLARRVR